MNLSYKQFTQACSWCWHAGSLNQEIKNPKKKQFLALIHALKLDGTTFYKMSRITTLKYNEKIWFNQGWHLGITYKLTFSTLFSPTNLSQKSP